MWHPATEARRLVPADLPDAWVRATHRNRWTGARVFLLSIPVALPSPVAAELVWIRMIVGRLRPIRRKATSPAGGPAH